MNKGGNEVQVDLTQFPIGIAVFTLFENAKEVAERLVFVNPHKSLNITLELDKPNYKAKEAIDYLMLTHGWKRFAWKDVLNVFSTDERTQPMRSSSIYGYVLAANDKPVKSNVYLMSRFVNLNRNEIIDLTREPKSIKEVQNQNTQTNQISDFTSVVVTDANAQELHESVVVAYDTQQSRKSLTASVQVVREDILEVKAINNTLGELQGRVPGLIVSSQNTEPNSGQKITIRGMSTLANKKPVIVVNDIIQHKSLANIFNTIDPADILFVNVNQSLTASSIYGARAINGVIEVQTKSAHFDYKHTLPKIFIVA